MNKKIYSQGGTVFNLSKLIMNQPHVLIGGTTGSGKSVLLNNFVADAMVCSKFFYFIDLKGVELWDYRNIPSCLRYIDRQDQVENVLDEVIAIMDSRFRETRSKDRKRSDEPDIYVVIDEYVDIKTNNLRIRETEGKMLKIVSKARAANIHVILCTQRCTNDILSRSIKANFTSKIGLRCVDAQESRNIIGQSGCELLPLYGNCLVRIPESVERQRWKIDMYTDKELKDRINDFIAYNNEMRKSERRGWLFGL